jgi:hypothetical protein
MTNRRAGNERAGALLRNGALTAAAAWALAVPSVSPAGGAKQAEASSVTVTITDRTLRVSPTSPASGATRFVVLNRGKKTHFFAISGPGLAGKKTGKIAPGKRATLTVTLKPGAYVLSDPVGLGAYTSAFLDVIRKADLSGHGNSNTVQPEATPPAMCGNYFNP